MVGGRENAGFLPEFAFSVAFPPGQPAKTRPPAANPALLQASIFTAGDSHRQGVPDPFGSDFEQALKNTCPWIATEAATGFHGFKNAFRTEKSG
jgi:hypothetical protein